MIPTFQVQESTPFGLCAFQHPKDENRTIFGRIKYFYIDGELEAWAGFDLCQFISGDITDDRQQDAILISEDGLSQRDCQIVMIACGEKLNERAAYLVSPGQGSADLARERLYKQYVTKGRKMI